MLGLYLFLALVAASGVGVVTALIWGRKAARNAFAGVCAIAIVLFAIAMESKPRAGFEFLANDYGAMVTRVVAGSPASRAGLTPNDLIVRVDGRAVHATIDVTSAVESHRPWQHLRLTLMTAAGYKEVDLILDDSFF